MSLYRRPNSPHWHYDFTVNGHRFRGSCQTDERALATLFEAKLRHDILKGALTGERPTITLDQALGRYWLEVGCHARSSRTVKLLSNGLRARLGTYRLTELTDDRLADFVSRRRGRVTKKDRLTSPATVNRHLGLLKAVLRRARDNWRYEVVPIDFKRHWLTEPAPRARFIQPAQFEILVAKASSWLKDPLRFSVMTGVRLGAAITLDWSAVDLQAGMLIVPRKSKREGNRQVVPITDELRALLIRQKPKATGPVWLRKGKPIKSWRTAFRGARKRAGIANFRWHDLRHTSASWALQGGASLRQVQEHLGHSTIKETMRYADLETNAKREAMEAVMTRWRHTAPSGAPQEPEKKDKTG